MKNQRGRAAVERERRGCHAAEADRDQVLHAAGIGFVQEFDRMAAELVRLPACLRRTRDLGAQRLPLGAAFVSG
jgi:hypothetical protein